MIPLCKPYVGEEEIDAVSDVLRSGWLAHGPCIDEFEAVFAEKVGVAHALSLNSCTSALELACMQLPKGSEVIVPSFTWVASVNSILANKLIPVFCDIDIQTRNIDCNLVESCITARTSAIMAVHYGGLPANLTRLAAIAESYKLLLIEDSAETIDASCDGKLVGSVGVGCFSFYPTKNMTTGEGGMLTTNDTEFFDTCKAIRGHGILKGAHDREYSREPWARVASMVGHNFRMPDILGAIGICQLRKLDLMNSLRRSIAGRYETALNSEFFNTPIVPVGYTHVYQTYSVYLSHKIDRIQFLEHVRSRGVGASVHFSPPVHRQPPYKNYYKELPRTDELSSRIVSVPIYPGMSDEEVDTVVSVFNSVGEMCTK